MLLELLLAASNCVLPSASAVVGLWELPPAGNNFGHAMELRADGSFTDVMTVMLDGRYQVSGESLTARFDDATDEQSAEASSFKVNGDTFIQRRPGAGTIKMGRVGPAPDRQALIVGVWRYRHHTGGTAFERYMPDGRLLFRLPMPGATTGCFTVRDSAVSLLRPRGHVVVLRETASDVLQQEGDDAVPFKRVVGGAWYALTRKRAR